MSNTVFPDLPVNRKIDLDLWNSSLLGSNITDEGLTGEFYFGLYLLQHCVDFMLVSKTEEAFFSTPCLIGHEVERGWQIMACGQAIICFYR